MNGSYNSTQLSRKCAPLGPNIAILVADYGSRLALWSVCCDAHDQRGTVSMQQYGADMAWHAVGLVYSKQVQHSCSITLSQKRVRQIWLYAVAVT